MNILIVDDNRDLADALAIVLEDEQFDVFVEYNGEDALQRFRRMPIDLVLLDVKLPDINGIEVMRQMRRQCSATRFFIMTGYRIEQMLSEVVEDGGVSVLRTPFSQEEWRQALVHAGRNGIILLVGDEGVIQDQIRNGQHRTDGDHLWIDLESTVNQGDITNHQGLVVVRGSSVVDALGLYLSLLKEGRAGVMAIVVPDVMDADHKESDALRSLAATGCLFKPFDLEYFLAIIRRISSMQAISSGTEG